MMDVLREVTVWSDSTPNHDYVLDEAGRMVAYRAFGIGDFKVFKKPIQFSKTRRKFKKIGEKFTLDI